MHGTEADIGHLPDTVARFIAGRIAGPDLGRTATAPELRAALGDAVRPDGLGVEAAWELFARAVVPNTVSIDSPRFLAFIPMAPSAAAIWMDAAVGAASFSAESWLEAAGAVAAENQALDFLRVRTGLPEGSGGCFTSGGSAGNLSALAVAREQCEDRKHVAVGDTAHASVANALYLLGMVPFPVATGTDGRFTGVALEAALVAQPTTRLAAIVASGGSTNAGVIDDLAGLADMAQRHNAWFHVDAAYGGAALLLPELADSFRGIDRADSVIIDPHKWLFSTGGSCALLYREPALAAAVHTQHGPYLDVFHIDGETAWNPSDYAFQLTRRASGLPFWFTLVAEGQDKLAAGVRRGVTLARYAANQLDALSHVETIVPPELSVVLFRREGWDGAAWRAWANQLLEDQIAFVAPTSWKGEPVGRLVFLHPGTTTAMVDAIVDTLRS